MAYCSFEDLDVWKASCRIATRLYGDLKGCRDFGLKDQMTRAAVSIPSNIAEGRERGSDREFVRFLHIAKGSAAELRTQIYIAQSIGLLSRQVTATYATDLKHLSAQLQRLIEAVTPNPKNVNPKTKPKT